MKEETPRKLCPKCKSSGFETRVEMYRKIEMGYCTYHYWLMLAGPAGMTLEDYVTGSQSHAFLTSLPTPQEIRAMEKHH